MSAPVRVGLVGAGWAAGLHLEGFRRAGAEIVGVYSRTRGRAERFAADHGITVVADSLDELIEVARPDIVSIASLPPAHHPQTLAVIRAGLHVLCDKPVAMDAIQAEEMFALAEKRDVRHASGFIWRGDPALKDMRELIRAGSIGRVLDVRSTCALGAPLMAWNWIHDRASGGGGLMQHGTHVIDRVRWLTHAEITAVCGRLLHDVSTAPVGPDFHNTLDVFAWARENQGRPLDDLERREVTADVGYEFLAELSIGARASFWESTHLCGPAEDEVVVAGEEGALVWSGTAGLRRHAPGREPEQVPTPTASGSGARTPHAVGLQRWHELAAALIESVRAGENGDHPTLADGWQVARVVDAVMRSHESRGWEAT
jgi:predicted dehydrogenase